MAAAERYEVLVVGSGEAGKYLAWTLSKAGQRTALVERAMGGALSSQCESELGMLSRVEEARVAGKALCMAAVPALRACGGFVSALQKLEQHFVG